MSFFKELKRRNVFKVGVAYVVTTWILLQLTDVLSGMLALPEWAPRLILLMLLIGFVPALILAWAFELTPQGIKLEKDVVRGESITKKTSRKLDYVIIVSLGLSLGYFIWESRFEQKTAEYESAIESVSIDEPPATITAIPVQAPVGDVDKNSIAVLPFANRSADSGDIYFTDGIHDDLLTQLSRIDDFSVISRTSVMEYRDTTKNLRDIARELGVANVMEGSVQRAGERVRINVQLIDANTDEHLWAEIYDRELTTDNLFDIQSEIAQAIAGSLKATLSASELASVADAPTDNVEAYDLYLQARRFAQISNDYKTAMALYEEALVLDPEFKLAWIGLAGIHMVNYWVYGGDLVNRELAREAIESARSIDPDFAELYMAEGRYWYWGFLDYERALYNLEKAIDMMPGNDEAYMWRGWASRRAGQWEQARLSMQHALKLNPRVSFNWHEYAMTLMYLHRYEEANEAVEQARKLNPDSSRARATQARIFLQASGDAQAAAKAAIGIQHSEEYENFEAFMLANLYARRYEEALEAARNISGDLEIQREEIYLRESWAALVLHLMGRQEEARKAGNAALFRLNSLRAELGEDYHLDLAEARVRAIQGADIEKVRALIERSSSSRPSDEVQAFEFNLSFAEVFAIAGLVEEATELVESLMRPPSSTSVHTVDLNPAFDRIRTDPAFMEMMARYR